MRRTRPGLTPYPTLNLGEMVVITMLFFLAVGIVIGWNLPQPPWARQWQDKAVGFVRSITNKAGQ
jgi:hypothetical protein